MISVRSFTSEKRSPPCQNADRCKSISDALEASGAENPSPVCMTKSLSSSPLAKEPISMGTRSNSSRRTQTAGQQDGQNTGVSFQSLTHSRPYKMAQKSL